MWRNYLLDSMFSMLVTRERNLQIYAVELVNLV